MSPRVLLVGEHNPYGSDPRMALFPAPVMSAGGRLCRWILGMPRATYLQVFDRRNLITDASKRPRWSVPKARGAAHALVQQATFSALLADDSDPCPEIPVIALGARVAAAFTRDAKRWEVVPVRYVQTNVGAWRARVLYLPHPSGRCMEWNDPESIDRARVAVRVLAPQLAPIIGVER